MQNEQFKVSEEDRIRMMRLSQEVIGRLTEMSMIVGSTMKSTPHSLSEVTFKLPQKNGDSIHISFKSPDESVKGGIRMGCYDDPPGICYPCYPA
jgi:hypothetical protein